MGDIPVPAPPLPGPADLLEQLQNELGKDEAANADLAKQLARLKGQIADLSKSVADAAQKSSAWDKAAPAADRQRKDVIAHITLQLPLLEAAVDNKKEITDAKAAGEKAVADLEQAVADAQANELAKQQELQQAHGATAGTQKAYDALAGLAAANDAVFKDLAALRAAAEKDRAANRFSHQYYRINVMEDVVQELNLLSPQEYAAQLNAAAAALAQADGAERLARDAANAATASRQQAEKTLATARSTMRDRVAAGIVESDLLPADTLPADGGGTPPPPDDGGSAG